MPRGEPIPYLQPPNRPGANTDPNAGGDASDPFNQGEPNAFWDVMYKILPYVVIGGLGASAAVAIASALMSGGAAAAAAVGPTLEQLGMTPAEIASVTGAATAAGAGAGAAGATGAAAAGTGVGVGETGAVSGLGGSGFGEAAAGAGAAGAGAATAADVTGPTLEQLGANNSQIAGLTGEGPYVQGEDPGIDWKSILGKAGGIAQKLGPILGSAAQSAQAANARRDANNLAAQRILQSQQEFALNAPGTRMRQSLGASLLSHAEPTKIAWGGPGSGLRGEIPQWSGGASAEIANLDPQTKALAQQVLQDELLAQMRGGTTGGGDLATPYLDTLNQQSTGDKILGGAALGTGILGGVGSILSGLGTPDNPNPTGPATLGTNTYAPSFGPKSRYDPSMDPSDPLYDWQTGGIG